MAHPASLNWITQVPKSRLLGECRDFFNHLTDANPTPVVAVISQIEFVDDGSACTWHRSLSPVWNREPFHDALVTLMVRPEFWQLNMRIEVAMAVYSVKQSLFTRQWRMKATDELSAALECLWYPWYDGTLSVHPSLVALFYNYDKISWHKLHSLCRRGQAWRLIAVLRETTREPLVHAHWRIANLGLDEPNAFEWSQLLLAMPRQHICGPIKSPHREHIIAIASHTTPPLHDVSGHEQEFRQLACRRLLALCSGVADGYLRASTAADDELQLTSVHDVTRCKRFAVVVSLLPPELHRVICGWRYGCRDHADKLTIRAIDVCWMAGMALVPEDPVPQ